MNHRLSPSNITLILANLVPLIGVLFLGWDGKGIFVIYILETIIIGVLNVLKMLVVAILNDPRNEPPLSPKDTVKGWGIIPFFIFHYFFFVFVQSVLYFAFSSIWQDNGPAPIDLPANFGPYITGETRLALISLTIANIMYVIENFILSGEYKQSTLGGLMFQPYKRIFLQQFVVIFGGFIFMLSGSVVVVAVLFILLKIVADYISANYNSSPKIQEWVKKNTIEKEGEQLDPKDKEIIERILKGR
ncbi:MAG TPA: DUF6498-containing protein [Bacteroidia bacterium]|nr:DUF6498-containing protein [Bacteroidia bacterium]